MVDCEVCGASFEVDWYGCGEVECQSCESVYEVRGRTDGQEIVISPAKLSSIVLLAPVAAVILAAFSTDNLPKRTDTKAEVFQKTRNLIIGVTGGAFVGAVTLLIARS